MHVHIHAYISVIQTLFETADHELLGGIDYSFRFVNMSDVIVGDDGNTVSERDVILIMTNNLINT